MTDVTCASGVDLLMEYLEGTLAADVRAEVEAHVAGCPRCVAFIASYTETSRVFRHATTAAIPDELGHSLLESLRARRAGAHDESRDQR